MFTNIFLLVALSFDHYARVQSVPFEKALAKGMIKSVTYDGMGRDYPGSHDSNGCPPGSATVSISKDKSTFNVKFGPQLAVDLMGAKLRASVNSPLRDSESKGPKGNEPRHRFVRRESDSTNGAYELRWPEVIEDRTCDLHISVSPSPGWSFSVKSFTFQGFVDTTNGLYTGLDGYYQFLDPNPASNSSMVVEPYHWIDTPHKGSYSIVHNNISGAGLGWSKCGEVGTLDIAAQVALRNTTATVDTIGSISITEVKDFVLDWKQC